MSTQRRQVPAWPRGPLPDRDPDRRPPAPPHPGFAQFPLDIDTDVCGRCRALVPATELARARHVEWDQRVEALFAAMNQMSDPGSVLAPPDSPGSDPTSGGTVSSGRRRRSSAEPPDPPLTGPIGKYSSDFYAKEGDALPETNDEGEGPVTVGGQPSSETAGTASAGPDPSLVQAWCDERGIDIRIIKVALRRAHPTKYKHIQDWKDLQQMRGPKEAEAIRDLDEMWPKEKG